MPTVLLTGFESFDGATTTSSWEFVQLVAKEWTGDAGVQPSDRKVLPDGPDAYFTRLPVRDMIERMISAGIPAELSLSAGTYVCNDTMYRLLHFVAAQSTIAGFIYVPDAAALPVETSAAALRCAVAAGLASLPGAHNWGHE